MSFDNVAHTVSMITAMPLLLSENWACRSRQGKGAHVKSSAF